MLESGLIPAMTGDQLTSMLKSLSPKDQRKTKRKFRKAWRKFAKSDPSLHDFLGLGNLKPSKDQIRNRSVLVTVETAKKV